MRLLLPRVVPASRLTTGAARERVGFEIPMPMSIAALRDPANDTQPAERLGPTLTSDLRAILIDGAPVRG